MAKYLITALLILTRCLLFAQDDIGKSSWIPTIIKIDGNPQEWSAPLRYYDHSTKLFFAFANNDKTLYICFQTPDETNQMKIMRAGIEVSLSTKSKHKVSISFPVEHSSEQHQQAAGEINGQQDFSRSTMRTAFVQHHTLMEVKGFNSRNGLIPINDTSGINAAMNWDEANKLTYEIAIPLEELYGTDYPTEVLKELSLTVKVNAVAKENRPTRSGPEKSFRGGRGGGGMSGSGGGMNRSRNTNGEEGNLEQKSEERSAMFEKNEFKERFTLAQKEHS